MIEQRPLMLLRHYHDLDGIVRFQLCLIGFARLIEGKLVADHGFPVDFTGTYQFETGEELFRCPGP